MSTTSPPSELPTTIESQFRIIRFLPDRGDTVIVEDIEAEEVAHVNVDVKDHEIRRQAHRLDEGNIVEATVSSPPDIEDHSRWDVEAIELIDDTTHRFYKTDAEGFPPGQTDEMWEAKPPEQQYAARPYYDERGGEFEMEIQLVKNEVEEKNLFKYFCLGLAPLTAYYEIFEEGHGTPRHLVLINHVQKPYLGIYQFPERNDHYDWLNSAIKDNPDIFRL